MLDKIELSPEIRLPYLPKEEVEVTLLSKEEAKTSEALQKGGIRCGYDYWTRTKSGTDNLDNMYMEVVSKDGVFHKYPSHSAHLGVRPVIKYGKIKKLIKGCNSSVENGVQVIEYGEFPHFFEVAKVRKLSLLQGTGKEYVLPAEIHYGEFGLNNFKEYNYKRIKVVEEIGLYYPVKPIKWYVDEENNMLISKFVLFPSSINNIYERDNDFEHSELYKYLNNNFLKQICTFLPQSLTNSGSADQVKITLNDIEELESRIENLLRRKQELLNQSEELDNELRKGIKRKVKTL